MYRDIRELRIFRRKKKHPTMSDSDEEYTRSGPALAVVVAIMIGVLVACGGIAVLAAVM